MKQFLSFSIFIFLFSCEDSKQNTKVAESLKTELKDLNKNSKKLENIMKVSDSLYFEIQTAINNDNSAKIKVTEKSSCNIKTLLKIDSLIEINSKLSDNEYSTFFSNIDPNCSINIEYSEFTNELIFKILETNPEKFISFLNYVPVEKEILEYLLNQLQNPISDTINLNEIASKLKETKTENSQLKKLVLNSISTAILKYN
ncbi:hypothetical protein [Wenyingzhuangia marina]|uniref:Lipoprotein n=1 Tax=Wenyingzhuangia marina TaxID=1195760 RepID=A0A1M5U588_9FLAO|nr:hypothetical protein [Wenyingzhuangia marina]GGF69552.1 hypothetical protein GCM10011397_10610 [Wenyingzhuangia marina]SHH58031.1 hypothetical protein SAMN05444281_1036 [Wenyingzhuangia marina]